MRKKLPAAFLATAALAASPALAAVVTPLAGAYKGRTGQWNPITVKVSRARTRLVIENATLELTCTRGRGVDFGISGATARLEQAKFKASFKGTSERGASLKLRVAGHFTSARRVTGTLALTVRYTDIGTCTSDTVHWTARHS